MRSSTLLLLLPLSSALSIVTTAPRIPVAPKPRCHASAIQMAENSPAALAGFAKDRAAGLAVAGTIGFVAEKVATRVPISLSPLLYATAFGIILGNVLRLFDPELKAMAPTSIGMAFAKRRLLRAGIILYGAKVTFAKILGIGLPGLLTDLYVVSSTLLLGFSLGKALGLSVRAAYHTPAARRHHALPKGAAGCAPASGL